MLESYAGKNPRRAGKPGGAPERPRDGGGRRRRRWRDGRNAQRARDEGGDGGHSMAEKKKRIQKRKSRERREESVADQMGKSWGWRKIQRERSRLFDVVAEILSFFFFFFAFSLLMQTFFENF